MFLDNIDKKYKIFYISEKTYGERTQRTQYQKIPKGSEKTYICDGAILTCPNIEKDTILTASGEYDASQKISFLVTEPKALLMGIDPLGSDKDIKPENFSVSKTTKCEKSPSGFC